MIDFVNNQLCSWQSLNNIKNHTASGAPAAGELSIVTTTGSERVYACFDGSTFVTIPLVSQPKFIILGADLGTLGSSYSTTKQAGFYTDFLTGDKTFYFEANLIAGVGGSVYADLYDDAGATEVTGSEIYTTTSSGYTRVRSGLITLSKNKIYYPRAKYVTTAAGSGSNGFKLIVV